MTDLIQPGTVYFIGAGPGAPDLITVRGQTILAHADLVVYADSLVPASIAQLARREGVQIVGSAAMPLAEITELLIHAAQSGKVVARVHTGDPAIYGATPEQMRQLRAHGIPYVIVPGVTAAMATAARLGVALTLPEQTQTVILTRAAGRTPVPERERLEVLAAHGATLALYLSIAQIEAVVAAVLSSGAYPPDTPVAVSSKVTWPDEQLIVGTLATIAAQVRAAGLGKHALILISPTLREPSLPDAPASRLYAADFGHGYRAPTLLPAEAQPASAPPPTYGSPRLVIIAVTRRGSQLASRLAAMLQGTAYVPARFADSTTLGYTSPLAELVQQHWQTTAQLVLIMATGVAVRAIAPLLHHKTTDPAVVCLDDAGRAVIPLVGGHQAGANGLAQQIAAHTGGQAILTTASDVHALPALDLIGQADGWRIAPNSALVQASAALVNGEPIGVYCEPTLPAAVVARVASLLDTAPTLVPVEHLADLTAPPYAAGLVITDQRITAIASQPPLVVYHPPVLVVGVGSQRGVTPAEVLTAIETTLHTAGLARESITALATIDLKADEAGIQAAAATLGVPLQCVAQAQLAEYSAPLPSPSAAQQQFGVPGVAEPCALIVAGATPAALLVPKQVHGRCTVAVARRAATGAKPLHAAHGSLTLVSLGPGQPEQMTYAARHALVHADVVIGYQTYIDQIRPLLSPHQEVIARPMQSELSRAQQALERATQGQRVVLVSSGDIGMYAMAGPVFELLHQQPPTAPVPEVTVLPGVSAFQAAAARVGAAINHDLCTISLSDLLTPWAVIVQRLHAAASGDFVVALYNPRSKGRTDHLAQALDVLRQHRPPTTPVLFARNVSRPDEQLHRTTLAEADPTIVDMLTVVLIGNRQSYWSGDLFITPRGYLAPPPTPEPDPQSNVAPNTPIHPDHPPHPTYPIVLTQMQGVPVLVVGGGAVAERKVRGLREVGAAITVISPTLTPQLAAWVDATEITWLPRAMCQKT